MYYKGVLMATQIEGVPFPIQDQCRSRDTGNMVYMTEVLSTTSGYCALCKHLHQYPIDIDNLLVTHVISPTKNSLGPPSTVRVMPVALKVAVTLQGVDYIPLEVSYLWWLDPTTVPLPDLEAYLRVLALYSTFPTVPLPSSDVPIDSWIRPRVRLQEAVRQHRAFLHQARDYPTMSPEDRHEFLSRGSQGQLDEVPAEAP